MNTPDIIEIDHLSFQYDGVNVLEDISFSIPKGAFLGLVGPNGSGKSTLIKCLLGLQKPSQGAIRLFGKDQSTHYAMHLRGRDQTDSDPRTHGKSG